MTPLEEYFWNPDQAAQGERARVGTGRVIWTKDHLQPPQGRRGGDLGLECGCGRGTKGQETSDINTEQETHSSPDGHMSAGSNRQVWKQPGGQRHP